MSAGEAATVRLVFADRGSFHHEDVRVPSAGLDSHERLIDFLREDPDVLAGLHVDLKRLCAAYRLDGGVE